MAEREILKKSGRKARRIRVRASCTISVVGSVRKYIVEIYDLSTSGMGILIKSPELAPNTKVQIDFRNLRIVAPFSVRGTILKQTLRDPDIETTKIRKGDIYRCSLRFEDPISEKQFVGLLNSFDIFTPEMKQQQQRKAR